MEILLLDDHSLFRDGLEYLLKALDPSLKVIQAATILEAQNELSQNNNVALLLIDLDMPEKNGFEAMASFHDKFPLIPCVILSASNKRSDVEKALAQGAMGYISKSSKGEALYNAIKLILSGEIYIPYEIMHKERRSNSLDRLQLSQRQKQVIQLVAEGHANKMIAYKLDIAEPTVKMHLAAIFGKLDVHNRTAALAKLAELQIDFSD